MTKGTPVRRNTTDYNLLAPLIGSTPYLLAARFLEPTIMQTLVTAGADPKATMPNGATALMLAAGMDTSSTETRRGIALIDFGKMETDSQVLPTVKLAFELSGETNAANKKGATALHAAVSHRYETVIQFLANHGADVNVKDNSGLTPLAALVTDSKKPKQLGVAAPTNASSGSEAPADFTGRIVALLHTLGATD
jgi:ankyrin repeat protein